MKVHNLIISVYLPMCLFKKMYCYIQIVYA